MYNVRVDDILKAIQHGDFYTLEQKKTQVIHVVKLDEPVCTVVKSFAQQQQAAGATFVWGPMKC